MYGTCIYEVSLLSIFREICSDENKLYSILHKVKLPFNIKFIIMYNVHICTVNDVDFFFAQLAIIKLLFHGHAFIHIIVYAHKTKCMYFLIHIELATITTHH